MLLHTGGQKVKVVLAAAMWNCPHLLVLDEPTNYLVRAPCPFERLQMAIRMHQILLDGLR